MERTPYPKKQAYISVRPGSYIALTKTPIKAWPRIVVPKSPAKIPPWLNDMVVKFNGALSRLNAAILDANILYAAGKSYGGAIRRIKSELKILDADIQGLYWPPVRPPFRNRKGKAPIAESDQFRLIPGAGLPIGRRGYVVFGCDVQQEKRFAPTSYGYAETMSIAYWDSNGESSEQGACDDSDVQTRSDCPSSSTDTDVSDTSSDPRCIIAGSL